MAAQRHEAKRDALRRPSQSAMNGALFGGVMGAALGPVGAIAGMIIGGLAGEAVERQGHAAPTTESKSPA